MHTWQRLLWREYRESAPFVLIGVALPLLCLAFRTFRGEIVQLPMIVITAMLAVWAAARAQEKRDRGLPISVPWHFTSRYLLPMVGVIPIGLALGGVLAFRLEESLRLDFIPLMLGVCVCVYLLSAVASSVFALLPAVVMVLSLAASGGVDQFNFTAAAYPWLLLYLLCVALITAVWWEGYRGKHRVAIGRIGLPLLMALVIGGSGMGNPFDLSLPPAKFIPPVISVWGNYSDDNTFSLDFDRLQSNMITLWDKRIPRRYSVMPDRIAPPGEYMRTLACLDRRVVLFAVQAPKDANIRVVAWDAPTGQVGERFRFTGWRGMLTESYTFQGPDQRYLLLVAQSKLGSSDFWLLDLQRGCATLAAPNVRYDMDKFDILSDVIWTPNRVILRLAPCNLAIDLQTLRVTPLRIGGAS